MSKYTYIKTSYLEGLKNKEIYMIGIGGSSMSVLAEFLIHHGFKISGSDRSETDITLSLKEAGFDIYIGHDEKNIKNPDLVVYTAAIKFDNPEYIEAKRKNIPIIERSVLLGEILSFYPKSISVSGTHGKTTTTSMITTILRESGRNPSVQIGGIIKGMDRSAMIGGDEFFVNEACEYSNSFLHFKSHMGIVLNIEPEHLDFFGTFDKIIESFENFVSIIPEDGHLIVCKDNESAMKIIPSAVCNVSTYSVSDTSAGVYAKNIKYDSEGCGYYDLYINDTSFGTVYLQVIGLHNISNSLAAIAACYNLGCTARECIDGIRSFTGANRRFEVKGKYNGITVVDDYAHHPSEITATLASVRKASYNKIWAVFQPHTYTRAKKFIKEFSESFDDCDCVIVTDIYASRESDPGDIHSSQIAEEINNHSNNSIYKDSLESAASYLKENAKSGDIIITLGAGDVNKICDIYISSP